MGYFFDGQEGGRTGDWGKERTGELGDEEIRGKGRWGDGGKERLGKLLNKVRFFAIFGKYMIHSSHKVC